ncbi:MAG TPA: metallopeptidase (SprT family) [Thiotrichaceae bacterium]|jgi:SprT protein|nr:metallopeptidase (SprT family) [Thiotrichaceae bacterium]HIM08323.1 metallopeptidase (SprT family) [Gammaproteobacteria bacterium]
MLQLIPLKTEQQEQIISATEACLYQASIKLEQSFEPIPVMFDLSGRAAGMYKINKSRRVIRYNPYIFAKYYSENIATTVPHEVAHYLVDVLYGIRNTRPHGREWKNMMAMFEADASVTCDFDLAGLPGKRYQRFDYACSCRTHKLTLIRHNRVLKGASYCCRRCKQELTTKTR